MGARTLMRVEEYLETSFEDGDREYLDGEIVERNMGELPHSATQVRLVQSLSQLPASLGFQIHLEIRIQIHSRRYRVADAAVWRAGDIGERIPTVPPFLVIEILSREDRMVRVIEKVQEYLSIGVEWVWVVDPEEKKAVIYSARNPRGELSDILRTENPSIEIPLANVLPEQK